MDGSKIQPGCRKIKGLGDGDEKKERLEKDF